MSTWFSYLRVIVFIMDMKQIRALVAHDLQSVNNLINKQLNSDIFLINQLARYITGNNGKQLRPTIVILAAHTFCYNGNKHINAAAMIEFIHTATLLHDDVIDESRLRRGKETANTIWGNKISVLVGDFLYSRAFQIMVSINIMEVMKIMANTTNMIAEGEVMQLLNCYDPNTTEERYLAVVHAKTAKLFESAAKIGAVLANSSHTEEIAIADYGLHLGTAFQLIDDVLDYTSTSSNLGKNIGDDLAEGKPTLPLIYAINHGTSRDAQIIKHAIETGSLESIGLVTQIIESTGALEYTVRFAKQEAEKAIASIESLPSSQAKDALIELANFAVKRDY